MIELLLENGYASLVDDEDIGAVALSGWYAIVRENSDYTPYVMRHAYNENGKRISQQLHIMVMERVVGRKLVRGEKVDHINGNGLDNRSKNLRIATHAQNSRNARLRVDNTSGFKGVSWMKRNKQWQARIVVNQQNIYLGLHATAIAAHRAYCIAAVKYHGEFANFGETSPFKPEDFKQMDAA